jgi:hypothetical protein
MQAAKRYRCKVGAVDIGSPKVLPKTNQPFDTIAEVLGVRCDDRSVDRTNL